MRYAKSAALAAWLLLAAAGLCAEHVVLLHNAESSTLHYLLDPKGLSGFDPESSVFAGVVRDFLSAEADEQPVPFAQLPGGQTERLEGLAEGTHLLVGFFAVSGRREFPVQALALSAGGDRVERTYTVRAEPALTSARPGRGRLAGYAAAAAESSAEPAGSGWFRFRIDNQYDDWEAIPPLLAWPEGHRPDGFRREQLGAAAQRLPIADARHWDRGGSGLSELKIVADPQGIYLYAASRTAMGPNLSIFLYLHGGPPGGAEPNRLTLELVPAHGEQPGLVVLWVLGAAPAVVGELASGSFFLEARADTRRLEPALRSAEPEIGCFDLTTAFFDRGQLAFEEFYYGTVGLEQIPSLDTLYGPRRP